MTIRHFLFITLLAITTIVKAQENTNRRFIINADKIAKGLLASLLGEKVVEGSIVLNEKSSMVRNDKIYKYFMLSDYRDDYKPTYLWLMYDFRYKNETVYTMRIDIDDSLKIRNLENYMAIDIPELLGWKQVLEDSFTFNYDKLQQYIKKQTDIDSAYKDIRIGYKARPSYIKKGDAFFIETRYYWLITIYSKTRNADNVYDVIQVQRELRIDARTGEVIVDKALTQPFPWMSQTYDN